MADVEIEAGGKTARSPSFARLGPLLWPNLQANLAGISVLITEGNTTVNAISGYVSDSQIYGIMPSHAPLGQALLCVSSGGIRSSARDRE